MKRKIKDGRVQTLFDEYHRVLQHLDDSGTDSREVGVVDFLSELRDQRTSTETLLTKCMDYVNIRNAFKQVKRNKGSAGVDKMEIEEAGKWLSKHMSGLRLQVLGGDYRVSSVRYVEIPKESGGVRILGIPTVLDRTIQPSDTSTTESNV